MKIAIFGVWHVHAADYTKTAMELGEVVGFYEENDALAEKYRERLRKEAPRMIRTTGEKIAACAVDDGSFAYFTASSGKVCHTSQGVTVARDDVREGDINGNGCSTKAPLTHMFNAFGVSMPPMFTPEDAELLFELMDARVAVEKQPLPKKSN